MTVISAFGEDQVERLTGITVSQLRYWARTGFFEPSLVSEGKGVAFGRIYSFKDITSFRVLNILRNQYDVSLQHLRKVATDLAHLSDDKWTAMTLFVLNRKVIFVEPGTDSYREIVSKQYVMGIPLHVVVSDTKRDIERMNTRGAAEIGQFKRARNVVHNALVIAGTRIPVAAVKRLSEDGYSVERIAREYPSLTTTDIEAALRHSEKTAA